MSRTKLYPASEALKKAIKNALARKDANAKILKDLFQEKIKQMVSEGLIEILVPVNEEQYQWGFTLAKTEIENAGYKVIEKEDETTDIPDIYISIRHLKDAQYE